MTSTIVVRKLGMQSYLPTLEAMQHFTQTRDDTTPDELWLLEHPAIYTLGQAGKEEHLLNRNAIPVLKVDRGGQVTYHGPGQLVAYTLIDLTRKKMSVHRLVHLLENTVINVLHHYGIEGERKLKAPGVYIQGKKICSVGLRIRRGCSYHGLAFNVNNDLSPFEDINPCGYPGLTMTRLSDFIGPCTPDEVHALFIETFSQAVS